MQLRDTYLHDTRATEMFFLRSKIDSSSSVVLHNYKNHYPLGPLSLASWVVSVSPSSSSPTTREGPNYALPISTGYFLVFLSMQLYKQSIVLSMCFPHRLCLLSRPYFCSRKPSDLKFLFRNNSVEWHLSSRYCKELYFNIYQKYIQPK